MRLCRWLRWKGLYGADFASGEELERAFALADAPFSCLRTGQPWGPDDAPSWPESCQPGRACFTPSPRDPGSRETS